ncbi:MAG: hypothetical protein SFX73_04340 [Kofleriaceae bacterium]|nr:hypothetical protein [Kofleriaceae bacterium]
MDRAPAKHSKVVWIVPLAALTAAGIATALVATMEDPDPPTWNTDPLPAPKATPVDAPPDGAP